MRASTLPRPATAALLVGATLPFLLAANCGLALDYTETALITDPVTTIHIQVDDGMIQSVTYDRTGILFRLHVFAFQSQIGDVHREVDGDVLESVGRCEHDDECSIDHMLEIPEGVGFDIEQGKGNVVLGYVSAPILATSGGGSIRGVRLRSETVDVHLDEGPVTLDFAAPPQLVQVEVGEGRATLTVPPGSYRCVLSSGSDQVTVAGITCDEAATNVLDVRVDDGPIEVEGA